MSESTGPATLLLHDGELSDVLALLTEVGDPPVERRGRPSAAEIETPWELVVATPRRLLELVEAGSPARLRVAVLDKDSRTARAILQRSGVELLVRRPVHPEALRLLLLYSLYRGPEKRRDRRVSVGTPVQLRAGGFRRKPALLADLSQTGARLLSDHEASPGKRASLRLPAPLGSPRGLSLRGVVVRARSADDPRFGRFELALRFEALSQRTRKALANAIASHRAGPAVLDRPVDTAPPAPAQSAPPEPRDSERRSDARCELSRRVVALGVEAARVLVGRDISANGMRVDADAGLELGDRLQLAIHVRAREKPLVVRAEAVRDDGEGGVFLRFADLSDDSRAYLARMVNFLPILAMRDAESGDAGLIVSEILAREDPH